MVMKYALSSHLETVIADHSFLCTYNLLNRMEGQRLRLGLLVYLLFEVILIETRLYGLSDLLMVNLVANSVDYVIDAVRRHIRYVHTVTTASLESWIYHS
jgi:hypothetical protein